MYFLKTQDSFDSAHFLKDYEGKCRNIHGHRWKVVAEIASETLESKGTNRGMVVDFSDLKDSLKQMCDELDHCLICEVGSLKKATMDALLDEGFRIVEVSFVPTAENYARYFYEKLKETGYPMKRVEVYETPNNIAAYEE
ncbi:MAG: 6-carboxytetrahydropterin synthase QueD [Lachnospiraceae bacterium]|nr:6-carboxytetrahydropterin synthase QueD [Lachnospiraceae bacterium]